MDAFFKLVLGVACILAGMLIGYALARRTRRTGQSSGPAPQRAAATAVPPAQTKAPVDAEVKQAPAAPAAAPASTAAQATSLDTARLYALIPPLSSFFDDSSHPREMLERREFKDVLDKFVDPAVPIGEVLEYATGANQHLCYVAIEALRVRPEGGSVVARFASHFRHLYPWPIYFALRYLAERGEELPVGALFVHPANWWESNTLLPGFFQDYLTDCRKRSRAVTFGNWLDGSGEFDPELVQRFLKRVDHPDARSLCEALGEWRARHVDRKKLASIGRVWAHDEGQGLVVEQGEWVKLLDEAQEQLLHQPPRSLLLIGEPGVGKTSFMIALAERLGRDQWIVFQASTMDLLAGQTYMGELEKRMQELLAALDARKRVIWYLPDFHFTVTAGMHKYQSAGIVDHILPAMTAGRVRIVGETTPAAAAKLLQARSALRAAVQGVTLKPLTAEQTLDLSRAVAEKISERTGLDVNEAAVREAQHLARQFLTTRQQPGATIDLLKLAVNRALTSGSQAVTRSDLIETLSQLSGLPRFVLDESEGVQLALVRRFFDERVVGQNEAVTTVVDRIAMLKAGLADPRRPIGVFLFAGPTGTGKTELARTLAEFLFGSADRMIRLDMSEYQTPDAVSRLLSDAGDEGSSSLVSRVRKQPFSLVLLDEFEKAHPGVWDLFLQVFDDGRLSDTAGNVADFRHCFVILTSNLGATAHQSAGLGFSAARDEFSSQQVIRAIHKSFRPEFLNRLDRVIVFRPLSRELMRRILEKELRALLGRRGFRNRDWAVEWEQSAVEFLLDKGFSPEMGARPLRRAIDEYLLAPLASTIVEHRVPEGDQFLFVRSNGVAIQVEFVDPDAEPAGMDAGNAGVSASSGSGLSELTSAALQPVGSVGERQMLDQHLQAIQTRLDSPAWEERKDELQARQAASGFWDSRERHGVLAALALSDRVQAATQTARSLRERLTRSAGQAGRYSRELMARLARQVYVIEQGLEDIDDESPVEVFLRVEPLAAEASRPEAQRWVHALCDMYRGWAAKRGAACVEIHRAQAARGDRAAAAEREWPCFAIAGFGACRTLRQEHGLHTLELGEDASPGRVSARVTVVASPSDWSAEQRDAQGRADHDLRAAVAPSAVIRRYRRIPSPLVRDAVRGWRTGHYDAVLAGDFDLIGHVATADAAQA